MRWSVLLISVLFVCSCGSSKKISTRQDIEFEERIESVKDSATTNVASDNISVKGNDSVFSNSAEQHIIFDTDKVDENGNAPIKEIRWIFTNNGKVSNFDFLMQRWNISSFSGKENVSEERKLDEDTVVKQNNSVRSNAWKLSIIASLASALLTLILARKKEIFIWITKLIVKLKF